MKTLNFFGKASGDCECFCWEVDAHTFKTVNGREPDEYDGARTKGLYKLYPGQILEHLGQKQEGDTLLFTIGVYD